jgi:uncharacterized protein YjiS (DUF1127 family)
MRNQTLTSRDPVTSATALRTIPGVEWWQGSNPGLGRHFSADHPQPSDTDIVRRFARVLHRIRAGVQQWRRARATYAALRELDARALRDIGLDPSEIVSVCAEIAGDAPATRIHTLRSQYGQPS